MHLLMANRKRVPHERFVAVWQASDSAMEAAHKLGMGYGWARVRAIRLRHQGISLKKFKGGRRPGGAETLSITFGIDRRS